METFCKAFFIELSKIKTLNYFTMYKKRVFNYLNIK